MPDRPLDERLALLLGWRRPTAEELLRLNQGGAVYSAWWLDSDGDLCPDVPPYSTTWEGAGLVAAAIEERHGVVVLRTMKDGVRGSFAMVSVLPTPYSAGFASYEAKGSSLPEALALAALAALGKGER